MTTPIALLVAAYGLLALLLLSLNLTSRWRWWIKAGAIVVTTLAFAASYFLINGMLGWPAHERLPARFALLNTQVVEPDKSRGEPGVIYMWVQEVDDRQLPVAPPRAYATPYSPGMMKAVSDGQDRLNQGEQVLGTTSAANGPAEGEAGAGDEGRTQVRDGEGNATSGNKRGTGSASGAGFENGQTVSFGAMPAPGLPPKTPLDAPGR